MIAVLHITCPHCGAGGQVVLPGPGAIVVGPCPQCNEIMAVFCGSALPLDKDVVMNGAPEERHEHVREVLAAHLDHQIDQLVEQMLHEARPVGEQEHPELELPELISSEPESRAEERPLHPVVNRPITDTEMIRFVHQDLPMIDDRNYFRAIFG